MIRLLSNPTATLTDADNLTIEQGKRIAANLAKHIPGYVPEDINGTETPKFFSINKNGDVEFVKLEEPAPSQSTTIYASLTDAIEHKDELSVGMFFETNGFHTTGDGGAARYVVSSTGTANGKNVVQIDTGKYAVLQVGDWILPEQLGYQQDYSRNDVVPYIQHAISIGCQHIHLRSSGTGAGYTWKTKLSVTVRGFKLVGEGDWGYPNKFSYVVFRPNDGVTEMLDLGMRDAEIASIDFEVTGEKVKQVDGLASSTYNMDETRFWEFRNLRFNSFRRCMYLGGTIKWQNTIKDCLFNSSVIGIEFLDSSTMQMLIENCQFIGCENHDILYNGNVLSSKMVSCNFGSVSNAVAFKVNSDTYLYHNATFENCNFENDKNDNINRPAIAIDLYDENHTGLRQNITILNCHFTLAKQSAPTQEPTNRFIRLSDGTNMVFINNQILGYDEPEHSTWVVNPKLLWNETVLPINGSIVCVGKSTSNLFPDELLPYTQRYNEAERLTVSNCRYGTESAWPDCDTWVPDADGQYKVCRVNSFEGTTHMPTTGFGFLWVTGLIDGPNIRVLQRLEAGNCNIYVRRGLDTGSGFYWEGWKTITAS